MDELQAIREALEYCRDELNAHIAGSALAALSRLEARAAETPDAKAIIKAIRIGNLSEAEAGALIGHYARLYSEDIRKDRDYWKGIVKALHDVIDIHLKNNEGK